MSRFSALLDACVMVPIGPCDTLLRMAEAGAFRPIWSEKITDEAIETLQRIHPSVDTSRFRSRFHSMNEAFDDALVRGWEPLESGIVLPDPDDRHVVAAAIRGKADVIVTENLKDFPRERLDPLGLEALSVDQFLLLQYDLDRAATAKVISDQANAMKNPPISEIEVLEMLEKHGARRFADAMRENLRQ